MGPRMRIDVISIFPDYFAPLQLSLVGKAIASGLVSGASGWAGQKVDALGDSASGWVKENLRGQAGTISRVSTVTDSETK